MCLWKISIEYPRKSQEITRLKKDLLQEGHTNPTPKCTLLTCVQMVACEVYGPSLQPSTWYWYTHLMPPLNMKGLHIGGDGLLWSWKDSWRGRLHCLVCSIRDIRSCELLGGGWEMVADGVWQISCGGGAEDKEEYNTLPSEDHRNPLPLNLPLPLPSFPIPQSPSTVPPSSVCGPPPSWIQPFSVNPAPERWKKIQGRTVKRVESHMRRKREREENKLTSNRSPHASSSGWAGNPPLAPNCAECQYPSPP